MSNVTRQKLGDTSDSCLGKMLDKEKNKGVFHPYLANYNVRWGEFDLSKVQEMKFEDHEHERYGLGYGDLVICEGGEPGRCAVWRDNAPDMKIQKALHRLRVKSGFSYDFLYYRILLANRTGELQKYFIGSTIKHLTGVALKQVEFDFPSHREQVSIAAVLRSLDQKIELNNRINAELEAMAKTLYDYWFVQFDFPDANGKPYKTSGGKMVHNPTLKREIPEGWSDASLVDIATFTNGIACQKYYPSGNEATYKVIKIREFSSGFDDSSESVGQSVPEKVVVNDGDILFSWSATLKVKLWTGGTGALNQHIFRVTSDNYPKTFYYFEVLKYLEYFKMVAELRKTTMGHITKDHLVGSRISLPTRELIKAMDERLSPILKNIVSNNQQNEELAKLRDWLLPMLMNGQVTVK